MDIYSIYKGIVGKVTYQRFKVVTEKKVGGFYVSMDYW